MGNDNSKIKKHNAHNNTVYSQANDNHKILKTPTGLFA